MVALVLALGGGAYAATAPSGARTHAANGTRGPQGPRGFRGFRGAGGSIGPQGPGAIRINDFKGATGAVVEATTPDFTITLQCIPGDSDNIQINATSGNLFYDLHSVFGDLNSTAVTSQSQDGGALSAGGNVLLAGAGGGGREVVMATVAGPKGVYIIDLTTVLLPSLARRAAWKGPASR